MTSTPALRSFEISRIMREAGIASTALARSDIYRERKRETPKTIAQHRIVIPIINPGPARNGELRRGAKIQQRPMPFFFRRCSVVVVGNWRRDDDDGRVNFPYSGPRTTLGPNCLFFSAARVRPN